MQRLSARPHHVGSPYGKDNAEWILGALQGVGLERADRSLRRALPDAEGTPARAGRPTKFKAKLEEPAVAGDPTSGQKAEQLPTYNAYSIDGDVTAPLVYVNYGRAEDYEYLDRLGISVRGAIVIARYGQSWRGIKPKLAAEHGAVGCLIYSDPRDDGYAMGPVFPNGPMRPSDGVQRGSVIDLPAVSGRPADAGYRRDARRQSASRSTTRRRSRRFPSCRFRTPTRSRCWPRSAGRSLPSSWRGSLPITLSRIGPDRRRCI